MTEPFINEIRKSPDFQAELVIALEEEMVAMMKEMEDKDAQIAALERLLVEGTEDGSRCNRRCDGVMVLGQPVNCSCHISPPCGPCEDNRPECSMCGEVVE